MVVGEILATNRQKAAVLVGEILTSSSSFPGSFIPNLMSKVVKHVTEFTEIGESSTCHQYVPFVSFRYRASSMRESRHTY